VKTLKKVNKKIKETIGDFRLVKGLGYFYVVSDDIALDLKLATLESTSIHVCHLTHQSLEDWLEDVREIVDKISGR